jgi:hypothetical protein
VQCAALQGRLSTTSVFHFGQRQTRPKRDSFLQFGLDVSLRLKVSTSKQSNQIEAIGYGIASIWPSPSKIYKNTAVLWGLLINYDNFSGKLTRIVYFGAKMCKKTCIFNLFWTYDSMFDHKWIWSLSKLCSVQHCKAGWTRPVFFILGKDKRDPNEIIFCNLDVFLRFPFQSSPIK